MAELGLGLAITSVLATTASLSKRLFGIYNSAKTAFQDANDIAVSIELFKAVLLELDNVLQMADGVFSEHAQTTVGQILDVCGKIFAQVEHLLSPLLPSESSEQAKVSLKARLTWHFKKNDVSVLIARLDSMKCTLHLMISVISLADRLKDDPNDLKIQGPLSPQIEIRLCSARDDVASTRTSLIILSQAEEEARRSDLSEGSQTALQAAPLAPLLRNAVTSGDQGSSGLTSNASTRSSYILSARCRSVTGDESGDVEMLIDKWTTLSEIGSKGSRCTKSLSTTSTSRTNMPHASDEQRSRNQRQILNNLSGTIPLQRNMDAQEPSKNNAKAPHRSSSSLPSPETEEDVKVQAFNGQRITSANGGIDVEAWLAEHVLRRNVSGQEQGSVCGTFSDLGIAGVSISEAASTVETRSPLGSASDMKRARMLLRTGKNLTQLKMHREALSLFREAYTRKGDLDYGDLCQLEFYLGITLAKMHKYEDAERLLEKVLATQKEMDEDTKTVQIIVHVLCRVYSQQSKWDQASASYKFLWLKRKVSMTNATFPAMAKDLGWNTGKEYAVVLIEAGKYEEAVDVLETIRPVTNDRGDIGQHHVSWTFDLARAYRHLNRFSEARQTLQSLEFSPGISASENQPLLVATINHELAVVAFHDQQYEEAHGWAIAAAEARLSESGKKDPGTIKSYLYLAMAKRKLEKLDAAKFVLEDIKCVAIEHLGYGHEYTIDIHLQLAEVLECLEQSENAEKVLVIALRATLRDNSLKRDKSREVLRLLETLGPLTVKHAATIEDSSERKAKLNRATAFYRLSYREHKKFLGQESEICLKTGHEYGRLCMLQDFSTAECVLSEVWSNRKKVLGETDPAAIDTGLSLSQVYFWEKKSKAAFAMMGSMHDLHTTLSDNLHCRQTIERAELLALFQLSESTDMNDSRQAIVTLEKTVEARTQVYGMNMETYESALRVAELAASCGNFAKSDEISTWVFKNVTENAKAQDDLDPNSGSRTITIWSGVTSSAMKFLLRERREGNRVLTRVVNYVGSGCGRGSWSYQGLAYLQAYLLFMQRDSRRSMTVLRKIYTKHVQYKGPKHRQTKVASFFLGLGLIADSVLYGDVIPPEVETLNMNTGDGRSALLATTCNIMAIILLQQRLASLAIPLLHWNYRNQKRRYGRLSRPSLIALAIMRVVKICKARRSTQISSNEGTPKDPRIFMKYFWEKALRNISTGISMKRGDSVPLLTTLLSHSFVRAKARQSFQRDMGICFPEREQRISTMIYSFLPGNQFQLARFEELLMSRVTPSLTTGEDEPNDQTKSSARTVGTINNDNSQSKLKGFTKNLNNQTKPNAPAVGTTTDDSSQSKPKGSTKKLNHQTNPNAPAVETTDNESSQSTPKGSTNNLDALTGLFDQAFQEHLRPKGARKQTHDARSNDLENDGNESVNLMDIFEADEYGFWSEFGDSLLDLAASSSDNVEKTEDRMSRLQNELTKSIVSEADIDAARSNVDAMEKEAGMD